MYKFEYYDNIEEANEIIAKLKKNKNITDIILKEDGVISYDIQRNGFKNIEIKRNRIDRDSILYDYFIDGIFVSHIEIQFDDNKFNGKILHLAEDEYEEMIYTYIDEDDELYSYVRNKAIDDFRTKYGK